MYAYTIQIMQTLLPQDHQKRLQYAIIQIDFLNNVLVSDVSLNGYFSKQNYRFLWFWESIGKTLASVTPI